MKRIREIAALAGRPEHVALELAVVLVAAGLAALAFAWQGAAALLAVPLQIPFLVSGGLGGLALVGLGLALFDIQTDRRDRARGRDELNELTAKAAAFLASKGRNE